MLVKKKDNTLRLCVDYRKMNSITVPKRYPIPYTDDLLDLVGRSTYYTALDCENGYYQIEVDIADLHKTAFITREGVYQWKRMPFGLINAPFTFQRVMNDILHEEMNKIVVIYLDDILIFSNSYQEHMRNIEIVLNKLDKYKVKLNAKKCSFAVQIIEFLGYTFKNKQISIPIKQKMKALQYKTPTTQREVRAFLGFCGYFKRFIAGYSELRYNLYNCTKHNTRKNKLDWSEELNAQFENAKQALYEATGRPMPDFNREFSIQTDASHNCIAGALFQKNEDNENDVVLFVSRKLNKHEMNYSITEKELLSVVWTIKKLRTCLFQPFKVYNDHNPISQYIKLENHNARVTRWVIFLSQFMYEIHHIRGTQNLLADTLTRHFENTTHLHIISTNLQAEELETELIKLHEKLGHANAFITYLESRDRYNIKKLYGNVKKIVKQCETCQKNSLVKQKYNEQRIELIKPFYMLAIHLIGPLLKSSNNKTYIIVCIDTFTRYVITKAVAQKKAKTVAKFLVDEVFLKYGVPNQLLSDLGREFDNKIVRNICTMLECEKIFTTAYNPSCNGCVERCNGSLISKIAKLSNNDEKNWDMYVPFATFALNICPREKTIYSPFETLFGHKANIEQVPIETAYEEMTDKYVTDIQKNDNLCMK